MTSKKNSVSSVDEDTIVAIITPPGEGGIAALRLAGRNSLSLLRKHFRFRQADESRDFPPFLMRYGYIVDEKKREIDEVLAVHMPCKKSFTGAEQVEIFCHGGSQAAKNILECLLESGARAAEPGEFTKMAFMSGRIDLSKAEAVAELIAANTEKSYDVAREHLMGGYSHQIESLRNQLVRIIAEVEASIDFPEDEISPDDSSHLLNTMVEIIGELDRLISSYKCGRILREGFRIAIAGRPNAGKSSLFNLLLRQQRALVTPTPGTTRDYLSEWIDLEGFAVNLIDTAGLRTTRGAIEKAGQSATRKIMQEADLILWMVDLSGKKWADSLARDIDNGVMYKTLCVGNKTDKLKLSNKLIQQLSHLNILPVSCLTEKGIDELNNSIVDRINALMPSDTASAVVTSARHRQKLAEALKAVKAARRKLKSDHSPELVAFDLRLAADAVAEITGRIYNEEILGEIFSKFCIGK